MIIRLQIRTKSRFIIVSLLCFRPKLPKSFQPKSFSFSWTEGILKIRMISTKYIRKKWNFKKMRNRFYISGLPACTLLDASFQHVELGLPSRNRGLHGTDWRVSGGRQVWCQTEPRPVPEVAGPGLHQQRGDCMWRWLEVLWRWVHFNHFLNLLPKL